MSISTDQKFRRVIQEQRERIRTFDSELESAAGAGDLDALFREIALARSEITNSIKVYADQFSCCQLVELQSLLSVELDNRLSIAISSLIERRTQSLIEKARRDPLTLLFNRAAFDERLHDEVERARRYRRNLSLVLFDIDCFKSVNDQYGHTVGDRILSQVAKILRLSLRKSDAIFRYGGDEFAAICPETSGDSVVRALQRIEISLRNYCVQVQLDGNIGISWGAAAFPTDAIEESELIEVADRRLYGCKRDHHQSLLT